MLIQSRQKIHTCNREQHIQRNFSSVIESESGMTIEFGRGHFFVTQFQKIRPKKSTKLSQRADTCATFPNPEHLRTTGHNCHLVKA